MYGKHRWHLFRLRPYFWAFGAYLLQVTVSFAEFTVADSLVLGAMGADVDEMAGHTARMEATLGAISDAWANSIPYITTDVNEIKVASQSADMRLNSIVVYQDAMYTRLGNVRDILTSHASANDSNLRDLRASNNAISSTLSSIHDIISGWSFSSNSVGSVSNIVDVSVFVDAISNVIASISPVNVFVTNFLDASGQVDMTIVTNFASLFGIEPSYGYWLGSDSPASQLFIDYLMWFYGGYGSEDDRAIAYILQSPFGFLFSALHSALGGHGYLSDTAFDFWNGRGTPYDYLNYSSWEMPTYDYTIFDAYNTLGLGVLTNQASAFLSIASANTNLLTGIFDLLNDSETGLASIADKLDDVYDALESGSPEDLDYDADYHMPEWQPQYSSHIDSNTNVYRFDDAMGVMTRNMFGNTTNQISTLVNQIGGIGSSDLSLNFDFSGFRILGRENFAGWSVATSFAGLEEAKAFFKGLSTIMFYVLDLCLVVVGCRRIQHVVIGDVGIL